MTKAEGTVTCLKNQLVLIAGSAAESAPAEKLQRAHEFVRLVTRRIFDAGGGLIVFASSEPTRSDGLALIFDWTILKELSARSSRSDVQTVVVTSEKAQSTKMTDDHRKLLAELSASRLVDIVIVPNEIHTGGNIGDEQVKRAVAMVAVGGGKGVTDRAWKLRKLGRPVLPFDLALGAISNDGEGAAGMHRNLLNNPNEFFPVTGSDLRSRIFGMSLERPVMPLEQLADQTVLVIAEEIELALFQRRPDVLILSALPVELEAIREIFSVPSGSPLTTVSGTNYWLARVGGQEDQRVIALASFGAAGNVAAAVVATELMSSLRPKTVILVGIAAGLRDKCQLGEVLIAERVVAYEGAALITGPDGSMPKPRPEQYRISHSMQQDVTAYLSNHTVRDRLTKVEREKAILPVDFENKTAATELFPRCATLASGEKLMRNREKFQDLSKLHGKIEVVDMEGHGIAGACEKAQVPYLIIRAISDFGDEKKDDRFHKVAARAAAAVTADFIQYGLRL
jgi:nucleoside phosphorylase